jgi:predicted nucleic acid-binding Zn ribbon protein
VNGPVAWIVCGAPAAAVRSTRRFCSDRCRQQRHRDRRNGKPLIVTSRALNGIIRKVTLAERGHDLYETPPEAILALLAAEDVPAAVWEPACSPGAPARVLRDSGRHVVATDLVDYGSPDQDRGGVDFRLERAAPPGVECIVTNPPYKLADRFAAHALTLCPRAYLLLRLAFLESRRRSELLESGQLARVLVFRERLPMMHRAGWSGPKVKSDALAFAWSSGRGRTGGRPSSTESRARSEGKRPPGKGGPQP